MNVVVAGTGYVGLVTGTCFAEIGNTVTCVDIDELKIENLNKGIIPIYEPGLDELVERNVAAGRLRFTTSLAEAMEHATVCFVAVGTPSADDGSANLEYVFDVARAIGRYLKHYTVVVDKSTVPVGTADKVRDAIKGELARRDSNIPFDVVSNPEFLKEGDAIDDFMQPDRVIVGTDSARAEDIMKTLYAPLDETGERVLCMSVRDAEMSKYAANAMLATKISFINEIANLCDRMGVDVDNVRRGIGSDSRIGHAFIHPGCGYGGSCFPKDVKALVHMANENAFDATVLNAVEARNHDQKQVLFSKVQERFGHDLAGMTFAVWGLAFKPGTDDMREASSLVLIEQLVAAGARVRVYDPVAMEAAGNWLPVEWLQNGVVKLAHNEYAALDDADALLLVTEWNEFRQPDFARIKAALRQPVIFDGRNVYDPQQLLNQGFEYSAIGREVYGRAMAESREQAVAV